MTQHYTIGAINQLPEEQKRKIYCDLIPRELIERYNLPRTFIDPQGNSLIQTQWAAGNPSMELSLFHRAGFPDPVLFGHLTDTVNGQIHVLLYILNDPDSQRFGVDRMPDGRPTRFGTLVRTSKLRNLLSRQASGRARFGTVCAF
jgi:hypothetical protein